jgi:hypothetical protein
LGREPPGTDRGLTIERERTALRTKAIGLGRLTFLLLISILALAVFWGLEYRVSPLAVVKIIAEASVLVGLAFVCAWRWSR